MHKLYLVKDAPPDHELCRYSKLEASTQVHRSSTPYKAFRAACGGEALLDRPSDLRYLEPLGIGFMTRGGTQVLLQGQSSNGYIVFEHLRPKPGRRSDLLASLRSLASISEGLAQEVQSFWALGYRAEDDDETVVLFQRFSSKVAFLEGFQSFPKIAETR